MRGRPPSLFVLSPRIDVELGESQERRERMLNKKEPEREREREGGRERQQSE